MRHDLELSGPAFRIRPVCDADATFVLGLRSNPELSRYVHPVSPDLKDQLTWFARYYERPDDYYFVIERLDSGVSEGLISVYDIDVHAKSGEWGRWLLRSGSLAAVESAWLIYRCCFERLGLDFVYSRTIADNSSVVSFHDSCGVTDRRLLARHFNLKGELKDAVEHKMTRAAWNEIGPKLQKLVELTARKVRRG